VTGGDLDAAHGVLRAAVAEGVTPGAAAEVGTADGVVWRATSGHLTFDAGAPPVLDDTPYDLASLTKAMATAPLVVDLSARGVVALEEPVAAYFADWSGADRAAVTIRDLLEHASGLPARLVDRPPEDRRAFEHEIGQTPLECVPRSRSLYSDLGFILAGFLAERVAGRSLDQQFEDLVRAVAQVEPEAEAGVLGFAPAIPRPLTDAAPTSPLDEDRRRPRRLTGDVHDTYAAALGGVAGHAGLFGTVATVGAYARAVLRASRGDRAVPAPLSPELVQLMTAPSRVPASSRALGWDMMRPTSSCGMRMSARAFGHVGFTGTSLWIDPDRNRYFVLLTNRVLGGATSEAMQDVRRAFHDALGDA
jgi:CubicO group peptidase (beta-lactamase class C family)